MASAADAIRLQMATNERLNVQRINNQIAALQAQLPKAKPAPIKAKAAK